MDTIKIIDPYENYDSVIQEDPSGVYGNDLLGRVQSLQVGFGSKVMRVDRDGLWLGSDHFQDAPFRVDMEGNITATTLQLNYVPLGGSLADIGPGNISGTYIASGAISTAKLTANAIDGMTITGALVRTSSSTTRVEMSSASNALRVLKSGTLRVSLDDDDLSFYNSWGSLLGYITTPSSSSFFINATNGNFLVLNAQGTSYAISMQIGGNTKLSVGNSNIGVEVQMTTRTIQPSSNNQSSLGTNSRWWNSIYVNNVFYSGLYENSDRNLKDDIVPEVHGLDTVLKLAPVSFKYKTNPEKIRHGFVAQDVESLLPELISINKRGIYSLNKNEIIPILVRAIQELKAEVETLKSNK